MNFTGTWVSSLIAERLVPAGLPWPHTSDANACSSNHSDVRIGQGKHHPLSQCVVGSLLVQVLNPICNFLGCSRSLRQFAPVCIQEGKAPYPKGTWWNYSTIRHTWLFHAPRKICTLDRSDFGIWTWLLTKPLIPLSKRILQRDHVLKTVCEPLLLLNIRNSVFCRALMDQSQSIFAFRTRTGKAKKFVALLFGQRLKLQSVARKYDQASLVLSSGTKAD